MCLLEYLSDAALSLADTVNLCLKVSKTFKLKKKKNSKPKSIVIYCYRYFIALLYQTCMNAVISFIICYDLLILSLTLFTFCAPAELSDIYKILVNVFTFLVWI